MSEPDPRWDWVEVGSWGGPSRLVRGRCLHADVVPVESVLCEVVAHLCTTCDVQLPAEWRPDRSTRDTSWPANR